MSEYASVADVRLAVDPEWAVGTLEPDATDQSAAILTDAQLLDAIRQASARIDSYLGGRYQTPIAPAAGQSDPLVFPDSNVRYWTRDIAAYLATLTLFRSQAMTQDEPVYLRATQAMLDLVAVRDGKAVLNLPPDATGDASASSGGWAGVIDPGVGSGLFSLADAGFGRYHAGASWTSWDEDGTHGR